MMPVEPELEGESESDSPREWWVYVLLSASSGHTYVGITVDLERRLLEHNGELPRGAKATRRGRPWTVGATFGPFATQSEALKVELRVKKLRGKKRLSFEPS